MLPQDGALRRVVMMMFVAVPLLFGIIAVGLGQDANWDLRNYHWYDAYALLHGRLSQDMAPAQIPTFYNPTLEAPFFIAANALPAKLFSFVLGAVQGCNFILLYLLAMATLRLGEERPQVFVALLVAFTGMIGGGHLALVGTIFYDNIVSLLVLAALLLVVRGADELQQGPLPLALKRVALAGVLVGSGVGLKLPTEIFAVGVCFGLLFVPGPFLRRFTLSFVCGLGVIAGFALFGGWWMAELWTRYANPLFPYFNDVLRSPWALPASYRDDRFLPKTIAQALTLPFQMFVDGKAVGEIAFRDGRVLAAYIVMLATPAMLLIKRISGAAFVDEPAVTPFAARYLGAAAALSYGLWLALFSIYRYIIPLEMLAPLLVVSCMAFWPLSWQRQLSLAVALLGFMTVTVVPGTWGRAAWSANGKFVDVSVPPIADPKALVLMTGFAPTSFVIPAFPPEVTFLRPHSYFVTSDDATEFNRVLRERLAGHDGETYLLQATWERAAADKVLPGLGLEVVAGGCRAIQSNLDNELELCSLRRLPSANP